jgi:hypothetical protein
MKITSDKPLGRSVQSSLYEDVFQQLNPVSNCIVLDTPKETNKVALALNAWAKKHSPGTKVISTKKYQKDGKPRVWLIYPDAPKSVIRGNFPKNV